MSEIKNELRKRARDSQNPEHETEFKNYAVLYKQTVMAKKKDFITKVDPCEDENVVINKRFWSHVKSNTKCGHIPDSVYYNGRYRN